MQCIKGCGVEIPEGTLCPTCWTEDNTMSNDALAYDGLCRMKKCGNMLIYRDEYETGVCDECAEKSGDAPTKDNNSWVDVIRKQVSSKKSSKPIPPIIKCTHEGISQVFTIGKGKIFADGDRSEHKWDLSNIDLILSLNGHPRPQYRCNGPAKELLDSLGPFPHLLPPKPIANLSIDWTDSAAPPFYRPYVQDLIKLVRAGTNILIHCVGGHGRTGTLLVAIAVELNIGKMDPVKWVRTKYCKKAVESSKQMEWLKTVYKITSKEKASQCYTSAYSGVHLA